jgi:hypothetical protein
MNLLIAMISAAHESVQQNATAQDYGIKNGIILDVEKYLIWRREKKESERGYDHLVVPQYDVA